MNFLFTIIANAATTQGNTIQDIIFRLIPVFASITGTILGFLLSLIPASRAEKRNKASLFISEIYGPFIRWNTRTFAVIEGGWGFGDSDIGHEKREEFFNEVMCNIDSAPVNIVEVFNQLVETHVWILYFSLKIDPDVPIDKYENYWENVNKANALYAELSALIDEDYQKCRKTLKIGANKGFGQF